MTEPLPPHLAYFAELATSGLAIAAVVGGFLCFVLGQLFVKALS